MFSVGYLIINFKTQLKLEGELKKNICMYWPAAHTTNKVKSNDTNSNQVGAFDLIVV